jgi:hypothetical protein
MDSFFRKIMSMDSTCVEISNSHGSHSFLLFYGRADVVDCKNKKLEPDRKKSNHTDSMNFFKYQRKKIGNFSTRKKMKNSKSLCLWIQ